MVTLTGTVSCEGREVSLMVSSECAQPDRPCHRSVWHLHYLGCSRKNSLPAQLDEISLVFDSEFD